NEQDECVTEEFKDKGEPFEDDNENGGWDAGEFFYNFYAEDNTRTDADGGYEGLLCKENCGPQRETAEIGKYLNFTTGIGAQAVIVMSGSEAVICTTQTTFADRVCPPPDINQGSSFTLFVVDVRGQTMPSGTTISVAGHNVDLSGQTSVTVPSTTAEPPPGYPIKVGAIKDVTKSASITVKVTTPGGLQTAAFFDVI
ncbi:MAG TPA: hypothetical protein VFK45_04525, partial [Gammaproteobacteria bacterium]|nr:hypothetical protein [Gammaproteobacteria bacterium]